MDAIETFFGYVSDATWGWALVPFLVVLGLFFTIASWGVQFRYFARMWRVLWEKQEGAEGHISARAALALSIGGRVGGGNVAGVAVAITLGGPGAVFWMWAIALVGMATSIVECSLAQLYKRVEPDGSYRGGPGHYIIHGLGRDYRWLAVLYAICLIAAFSLGFVAFQANTVAGSVEDSFGVGRVWTAVALAAVAALIVTGGIRRIARTAEAVVPVMAAIYLALAFLAVILHLPDLPDVLYRIVANALGFEEAVAGGIGAAIAQGIRRGLFSNEAGLGSVPNVAATAYARHPVGQGIVQSLSVFIATIVICSATALMILLGDVYQAGADIDGVVLVQDSLANHFGAWAQYFLSIALVLFAFSSIIYNYYLGETALTVMTEARVAAHVLKAAVIAIVFAGGIAEGATAVFFFSDPLMGLLALVNLLALIMLFPIAMRVLSDFTARRRAGEDEPLFDAAAFPDLDIDREAWRPGGPAVRVAPAAPAVHRRAET
ncbi:MAG: alanine/glycine:cation symporter family protein [Paracoccaceae bacterium]